MHLVVNLFILAVGIILINAEPLDENLQSGSVEIRESSEDPMLSFYKGAPQRNDPIPLVGLVIKARSHGYCLRRLSSLVPGTPDGFKGWKREYNSGYVAVAEKLYFMFRCDKRKAVERAQRVRRQPMNPTFPPRPCVNGTMASSANGEQESGTGATMEGEAVSDGMEGLANEEEQRQEEEEKEEEEEQEQEEQEQEQEQEEESK